MLFRLKKDSLNEMKGNYVNVKIPDFDEMDMLPLRV